MSYQVRICEEAYYFLQSEARPFEDTVNTVLMRLIEELKGHRLRSDKRSSTDPSTGCSEHSNRTLIKPRSLSARQLVEKWEVKVNHALYHRDGRWYGMLKEWPGALMDPYGYIVFAKKRDYFECKRLSIDKDRRITNVKGRGISEIDGYRPWPDQPEDPEQE